MLTTGAGHDIQSCIVSFAALGDDVQRTPPLGQLKLTAPLTSFTFFTQELAVLSKIPFTRYRQLSNGLTTGLTTVLNEQWLFIQPVVELGCTTGLTNTV